MEIEHWLQMGTVDIASDLELMWFCEKVDLCEMLIPYRIHPTTYFADLRGIKFTKVMSVQLCKTNK
jgi:hypothetical protein